MVIQTIFPIIVLVSAPIRILRLKIEGEQVQRSSGPLFKIETEDSAADEIE